MSLYQQAAAKRYPRSAARRRIFGDGPFVLLVNCQFPGKILLFQTAESRQAKLDQLASGCCFECRGDHVLAELTIR